MANVSGTLEIIEALRVHRGACGKGVERGLKLAGLFLQRASQKVVPIDTGVLRNTAATRARGSGLNTVVEVSYGTNYAVFVHEDLEAQHKPGKTAKFLEQPFRENREIMAGIVADAILHETGRAT